MEREGRYSKRTRGVEPPEVQSPLKKRPKSTKKVKIPETDQLPVRLSRSPKVNKQAGDIFLKPTPVKGSKRG